MGFDGVLRSRIRQALIIFQQRQGLQASGPGSTPHDVDANPPRWKAARPRWFSTGHDGARSDIVSTPVLARQSSPVDPATPFACASATQSSLPQ
jgi:hypothetical protein